MATSSGKVCKGYYRTLLSSLESGRNVPVSSLHQQRMALQADEKLLNNSIRRHRFAVVPPHRGRFAENRGGTRPSRAQGRNLPDRARGCPGLKCATCSRAELPTATKLSEQPERPLGRMRASSGGVRRALASALPGPPLPGGHESALCYNTLERVLGRRYEYDCHI